MHAHAWSPPICLQMVNRSLILKQLQKPTRNLRKRGPRCSIDSQRASGVSPSVHQQRLMGKAGRAVMSLDLPRCVWRVCVCVQVRKVWVWVFGCVGVG